MAVAWNIVSIWNYRATTVAAAKESETAVDLGRSIITLLEQLHEDNVTTHANQDELIKTVKALEGKVSTLKAKEVNGCDRVKDELP